MVLVESKAKKWGHSVGFIIPKQILTEMNVQEGEVLQIDIKRKKKMDGFGRFPKAKPFRELKEHSF